MKKLRQFRDKTPGVADLLNYIAVVDDGVVMCKDGSFLAGWAYRGDDQANSTPDELNALSVHVNMALARLGNGWMTARSLTHCGGVADPKLRNTKVIQKQYKQSCPPLFCFVHGYESHKNSSVPPCFGQPQNPPPLGNS